MFLVALADRRVLVDPVAREGLGVPVDLVAREAPVGQAALAVLRPVAPARSQVLLPLR
ncbi:hypothetical protein [Amycolatopsis sp. lyj-90]|uniref:hypothetical protein n=1 Tax=Amycolatopsis sp. lyj-90 TaxID=2789285 RepID=UPI00397C230D